MSVRLEGLDYSATRPLLERGELTAEEATQFYLRRIDDGKALNAFISVFPEAALAQARDVDQRLRQGRAGKLAGMVIAVKDNIALRGRPVTCGSRILETYISPYDATVVQRLRAEDAIFIGKTNMDEFAMGSSTENSYFGPARNPYDPERVPGGSSGGSAVAVAAALVPTALGSDTGGSIRQPAALCGVVGLKPTYGRVSRFGLVAFASSLDQIGPITRSVADCALLLEVISGHDPRDSTSANVPVPEYRPYLNGQIKGLRVGLPREYFAEGLNPEVRDGITKAVQELQGAGATLEDISLPHTDYAIATYYIVATAEASSNLARYDGARYGYRAPEAKTLEEMYTKSRSQGFGTEVKRRIMLGTFVLSAGYYEAYYGKALKVRTLIKRDFDRAFEKCDVLITPTSPTTAFKLGEKIEDPLTMYLSDIYTVSVNLAGLPGISVPCGVDSKGLPIGLQIVAKPFDEGKVLQVASFLEKAKGLSANR